MIVATFLNNAEAAASGTTITTTNSGDNSAGDAFNFATGGTRTYDDTWCHSGTTSWKIVGSAGSSAYLGWNGGADKKLAARLYIKIDAFPTSAECIIMQARIAGSSSAVKVAVATDGKLHVTDYGSGTWTSTGSLSTSTTYRIELVAEAGTTTSNGTGKFAYYEGDSTSPVQEATWSNWNLQTSNLEGIRWGKLTDAAVLTIWTDDAAYAEGATDYLGPAVGASELVFTRADVVRIDTTGSVGTVTLEQTQGATAAITQDDALFWIAPDPAATDLLLFDLTAAGDGDPVTEVVTVTPGGGGDELVLVSGDPTVLTNWH